MANNKVIKSDTKRQAGGSRKGIPNKNTTYLIELLNKHNFDPAELLIHVAKGDYKALGYDNPTYTKQGYQGIEMEEYYITVDHRIDASKTLTAHVYPKRKAIEFNTENDDNGNSNGVVLMAYDIKNVRAPKDVTET